MRLSILYKKSGNFFFYINVFYTFRKFTFVRTKKKRKLLEFEFPNDNAMKIMTQQDATFSLQVGKALSDLRKKTSQRTGRPKVSEFSTVSGIISDRCLAKNVHYGNLNAIIFFTSV